MNILIIFAHPDEQSFCASLRDNFIAGLQETNQIIRTHNLYKEKFNPILSREELRDKKTLAQDKQALQYQRDIIWAEIIVIIHPAYWYGVPAILKGYFDRLFTEGFAYDYIIDHPEPKLLGKKGILIQTFDAEEELEKTLFEDTTYKSVYFPWKYCGIDNWERFTMFRVSFVDDVKRNEWLKQAYLLGKNIDI
ncbi:MAG: NAD(P)H-dependent oxidoreductase [Candidatus Thorarchaeota archaeon]